MTRDYNHIDAQVPTDKNGVNGMDQSNIEMGYLHLERCKVQILPTTEYNEPLQFGTWIDIAIPSTSLVGNKPLDVLSMYQSTSQITPPPFCCRCNLVLAATSNQMAAEIERREDDYFYYYEQEYMPRLELCGGGPRYDGTVKDINSQRDARPSSKPQHPLSTASTSCTCQKRRKKKRSDAALLMGLALTCQDVGQIKIQSAKLKLLPKHDTIMNRPPLDQRQRSQPQPYQLTSKDEHSYYDASIVITMSFPHLLGRRQRTRDERRRIASHSSKKFLPASTQLLLSTVRSDWETFEEILTPPQRLDPVSVLAAQNRREDPPTMFPSQLSLEEVFKRISAAGSSLDSARVVQNTKIGSIHGEILSSPARVSYLLALPQDVLELKIAPFLRAKSLESLRRTCTTLHHMLRSIVPGMKLQLYAHQINSLSWMRRREIRHLEENDFLACTDRSCTDPVVGGNRWKLLPHDDGDAHRALTGGATVYLRPRQYCSFDGTGSQPSVANGVRGVRVAQDTGIEVDLPPDGALSRKVGRCGLLCDSPGLGKTISILSLILQTLGLSTACAENRPHELDVSAREEVPSGELDDSSDNERIFAEYWKENVVPAFRRPALNRLVSDLLRSDKESCYFLNPVDPEADDCLDYFEVIKRPICIRDIRKKIETNEYGGDFTLFLADVELCFG